jgi:hypothetical protein
MGRMSTPRKYPAIGAVKPLYKNERYIYSDRMIQDKRNRKCLKCDRTFLSINELRICNNCKAAIEFDN